LFLDPSWRIADHAGSYLNLGCTQWDSPERVNATAALLAALSLGQTPLATLHQIHSDRIHIIREAVDQWNQTDGDALITQIQNLAIAARRPIACPF